MHKNHKDSAPTPTPTPTPSHPVIAFIGGGNMASAIIGGLTSQGHPASQIEVVEPWDQARAALHERFGIEAAATPGPQLARAALIVWAVKPQTFKEAALAAAPHTGAALHLSVAAGITTASIAAWLGSERIIRAMPNTPALVGRGMTGLFAGKAVAAEGRALAERIVATTGQWLWVDTEDKLDAVTALSGSGPAYVFLFLEAMIQAGTDMGLTPAQAHQLAVATFQGAAELAARSGEAPEVMRQRVTSQGGTTHAAITHLQAQQVPAHFVAAMRQAQARAQALAAEFGG